MWHSSRAVTTCLYCLMLLLEATIADGPAKHTGIKPLVQGNWSKWKPFTPCSAACGGGVQHRDRTCIKVFHSLDTLTFCPGASTETRACNVEFCNVVQTQPGKIQGLKTKHLNKKIHTFLGIPFAEPPIGHLRFQRPVKHKKWDGVKDAVKLPKSCYQAIDTNFGRHPGVDMWNANTEMNEDCLYLNVWTPSISSTAKKAVLVWIFGGGFFSGTSTLEVYDGGDLAALNDVVVVSMNYRVGPLGFLYYGDNSAAPGNMGLLDQQLSLQWVYDNIELFGGDNKRITLFGESAGAVSVALHMMAPLSKNLFTRASLLSGSAYSYWGVYSHQVSKDRSTKLAEKLGCNSKLDTNAIVACLRQLDASAISDMQWYITDGYYFDPPFSAVVDGYFLVEHPRETMKKKTMKQCDVLGGSVADEGNYWLLYGIPDAFPIRQYGPINRDQFLSTIDTIVNPYLKNPNKDIKDGIVFQYEDSFICNAHNMSYRDILDDLSGDILFTCSVNEFMQDYAENGQNVYMYEFAQRTKNNYWPLWMGVLHGYELEFLFGWPLNASRGYTVQETQLSREMMTYWSNFAKTGDPNLGDAQSTCDMYLPPWPKYSAALREYTTLKKPGKPNGYGYRHNYCSFWKESVPKLQNGPDLAKDGKGQDLVQTHSGKVRGLKTKRMDKKMHTFLGIPFAEPPIGHLRFQRPVQHKKWDGVKDAVKLPKSCHQGIDTSFGRHPGVDMWNANTEMSEDCLYLNVWTPSISSTAKKAVLVWIFGGGFFSGTSTLEVYDGGDLAALNDVVVVSMNYRVGPLGFLYFGDNSAAPGNMGLLDQQLSLQWVYDNIELFGGDNKRITLFGESAGAVSVALHMMAPLSKHLFTRASLLSGSAYSYWGVHSHQVSKDRSIELAKKLRCNRKLDTKAIVACLRQLDASAISDMQWYITGGYYFDPPFSAVVDGYFLVEHPRETMKKKTMKKCDVLGGSVADEGNYWLLYGIPDVFPLTQNGPITRGQFLSTIDTIVEPYLTNPPKIVKDGIVFQYEDSIIRNAGNISYRDILDDLSGDILFTCSVNEFIQDYAENGQNVYMYEFAQRTKNNYWPLWMGVLHGYELEFLFGWPLNASRGYTAQETQLSREMMTYWSNFAKTGDPNLGDGQSMRCLPAWPKYTAALREYTTLTKPGKPNGYGYRHNYCSFWNDFLQKLVPDMAMGEDDGPQMAEARAYGNTATSNNLDEALLIASLIGLFTTGLQRK